MQLDLRAIFVTEPSSAFSSEIWLNVPHHLCLICSGIFPPQISWGGGGRCPYFILFPQFNKDYCSFCPRKSESENPGHSCFGLLANSLRQEDVKRTSSGLLCASFL